MPRRRSFTITFSDRSAGRILAYSPEGAERAAQRHGNVVAVEPTPRRVAPPRFGPGFVVNDEAVAEACEVLGVRWPVKIRTHGRASGVSGKHTLAYTGGKVMTRGGKVYGLDTATGVEHSILVKSYLDPAKAGETLWHELTHAMQAERAASAAGATTPREVNTAWHAACNKGIAYSKKPIEVEAREFESWNDDHPLCR